ncbi:hypothetical protein [endosymbiont of Lamellibrachia barhami]|uniref:hypothetical protein n=1 Tax=endosymbiont of Lamellibrachia barhami TaxID=205975 RepID=UPI0015B103E3|nr:hypothetical protein [endosymbiont of Lamellibrachia barhami]
MQSNSFMNADAVESLVDEMAGKLWSLMNERGTAPSWWDSAPAACLGWPMLYQNWARKNPRTLEEFFYR